MKQIFVGLPGHRRAPLHHQLRISGATDGWELRLPDLKARPHSDRPVDRDALAAWLERTALGAAGVLVSIDTLVYGGLPTSHLIADELNALLPRLALLRRLKMRKKRLPIHAFATCLPALDSKRAHERPGWAVHGSRLWSWSHYGDKHAQTACPSAATLAVRAEAALPAAIREEFRALSARNFAVTAALLELVTENVIDRLVLTHQDSAEYGFEVAERRELQRRIQTEQLAARVLTCGGDDALMPLLVSGLVRRRTGLSANP